MVISEGKSGTRKGTKSKSHARNLVGLANYWPALTLSNANSNWSLSQITLALSRTPSVLYSCPTLFFSYKNPMFHFLKLKFLIF
jgi:hypothetical protein